MINDEPHTYITKLPKSIIWATIILSFAPFLLQITLINFGNPSITINQYDQSSTDIETLFFDQYIGVFVHLILEWSGVMIALSTAVLSFVQYKMTGNTTAPIIGLALFFSGFMDAFHTLAATKIIESFANNENFIPFTWALSRFFNAGILFLGIVLVIMYRDTIQKYRKNHILWIICFIFFVIAYSIIHLCAISTSLPQTAFPDAIVSRPYDIIPLLFYILLGIQILPKLYKKDPCIFVEALMWSMLPAIATQLHIAFGTDRLFDGHFNIAHFLKVISYLIPFLGIIMDYMSKFQIEKLRIEELENAKAILESKNKELEQFAFITSHDLQEPLRTISSFSELLQSEENSQLSEDHKKFIYYISQAAKRMTLLIHGLLEYSQLGKDRELQDVDLNQILDQVQEDMHARISSSNSIVEYVDLPIVKGYPLELRLLFQNLISNAIKFKKESEAPFIKISTAFIDGEWMIGVQDNGIGINEKYLKKIFVIFQRLCAKNEGNGTGIGLAHCQKIVVLHHGQIWVESEVGIGSTFYFTINTDMK